MTRPQLARAIGISTRTVTNIYRRESPEGIADVTISRLAVLLGMSEPELMTKYLDGLPDAAPVARPAPAPAKQKRKQTTKGKR